MARISVPKTKTKAKAAPKVRVTAAHVQQHREHSKKDHSPSWEDTEKLSAEQFNRYWHNAMSHYRLEYDTKQCKQAVITWMVKNNYPKDLIAKFKATKDWRVNSTMGGIAACLNRGMPSTRADFNKGRDTAQWLGGEIAKAIEQGANDIQPEEKKEVKATGAVMSIQDRVRETALGMTEEIEDAIENFQVAPDSFDPKSFKMLNLLRGKGVKAAHARIIKEFYGRPLAELEELASGKADEQLKEGYSHRSRKQIRSLIEFYKEIASACTMLAEEAKILRAPRAKKVVPKDKLVEKLKYLKLFDALKLVSINPTEILGAKELWIYNTKIRKLGKYVAADMADLGVKGTTITGFDETKSIQKTLRRPIEQIKEFKAAGKVALRKFLEDINAVDTKLNGRINEDIVLLKVA